MSGRATESLASYAGDMSDGSSDDDDAILGVDVDADNDELRRAWNLIESW